MLAIESTVPENPLGELLSMERNRQNISQSELARRAGVSSTYIRQLEEGVNPSTGRRISPSLDKLAALAKGLRLPVQVVVDVARGVEGAWPDNSESVRVLSLRSEADLAGRKGEEAGKYVSGDETDEPTLFRNRVSTSKAQAGKGTRPVERGEAGGKAFVWVPLYASAAAGVPVTWTSEDALGYAPIPTDWIGLVDAAFVVRGNSVSARGVIDGDVVYVRRLNGDRPPNGALVVFQVDGGFCVKVYRHGPTGDFLESHEMYKDPVSEKFGEVRLLGVVKKVLKDV